MKRAAATLCAVALVSVILAGARASEDDYGKILGMSYTFYEGQMSGNLPSWNQLLYSKPGGWKKTAHLNDGRDIGADLSGGYYDAGDYLKISHPLAWGTANLIFSMLEFKPAYEAAGQWDVALRDVKWALDWLIKAHIKASDSPGGNVFVGQLSGKNDHHYFGRPEHATNERPVYIADASTGGADLVGEYAAAYAAGAVLFKQAGQGSYAATLYNHAKQAFGFATTYKNTWKVPPGVFQAYSSYWPEGYIAHLAWAAAWMCKYDSGMCGAAEQWWSTAASTNNLRYGLGYDWDSTLPGAAALIVSLGLPSASAAKSYLEGYVLPKWEDTSSKCPKPSYSTVCYTPKGLAYYSDWGTLRNTGNMMFIAALMGKLGDQKQSHICWARSQMRYITGASTGKSYLIGYGQDQPQRPHHRQSACKAKYTEPCSPFNGGTCCAGESGVGPGGCCDESNFAQSSHPALITLTGALVGGPDQSDNYPDIRNDYQRSEVAYDYNAGFTGAAAGLAQFAASGALAACGGGSGGGGSGGGGGGGGGSGGPNPPPPSGGNNGGNCKRLDNWQKCGGIDTNCPSGSCTDAAWQGFCCPSNSICKRDNPYFWMCTPATRTASVAALAAEEGIPEEQAAATPVDVLELIAPAAASAAAGPVEVSAVLVRRGEAVPGAVVDFVVEGPEASVTVSAVTGEDGVARAVLPAEAAGAAGSSSVVSAFTPDGKAVGAKGSIAISAASADIAWE